MFWIYLFGAIAVIVTVGLVASMNMEAYEFSEGFWGHVSATALALFMSAFAFVIAALLAMLGNLISAGFVNEEYQTQSYITTGGDSNGVNGRFSLFGGYIENAPVYMYYVQNDRGEFRLYHANASEAFITYTNEAPKVVYTKRRSSNDFWALNDLVNTGEVYQYEFRVPTGSVKQGFNYDAQ